ncbi:zinc-binding dehydrogenase [Flammeovirga sp. SJP92]|uniref:zinc-binding dehydrogenase n=1 Tax=Flammeovirga sp. SJP92 TaxID=1775430 RepID=UPI000786D1B8|nr:zinc-binding dehydrogenase [Flammeovirga sp. SJP92]KXX71364.1 hypothetical protein AVL50_32450 [Flammeovirga sp. SJP92]
MKAYLVRKAGGPEALEFTNIEDPIPEKGKALIKIRGFGLNRAEAVTRMGGSFDAVKFPKVIGIECIGEVVECPDGTLQPGQKVAAAMGEMGRKYNGSYAEMTLVPLSNVFPIETELNWTILAAIPETYLTAWGCVIETLKMDKIEQPKVVVRPGASALGLAISSIINHLGGEIIGVTRSPDKVEKLKKGGMHHVIVSAGTIDEEVRHIWPDGVDGVVDTIVSEVSVKDDLAMLKPSGKICLAGSLAESYQTDQHADFQEVLKDEKISFYGSDHLHVDKDGGTLQHIIDQVEQGHYKPNIDAVYSFEELIEAHEKMDKNTFAGKVVILL